MKSVDKNRNLVAALSYLVFFITGIVVLLVEDKDRFIRFHAMQSTVVFGGLFGFNILIGLILRPLGFLNILGNLISVLIALVVIFVWLVSMVTAYQGQMIKWPIAGDFAEKKIK